MATPASQLGITPQPRREGAPAAQPRNGNRKLASPTAAASFHLSLNTMGSSSAPARKVSTIAPMPARNLTQPSSVPSTADPMNALKINWAVVPTMISDSAVETRSQTENRPAITARPSHNAASAHTLVMLILAVSPPGSLHHESTKKPPCGGSKPRLPPLPSTGGGIIPGGGVRGAPPPPGPTPRAPH